MDSGGDLSRECISVSCVDSGKTQAYLVKLYAFFSPRVRMSVLINSIDACSTRRGLQTYPSIEDVVSQMSRQSEDIGWPLTSFEDISHFRLGIQGVCWGTLEIWGMTIGLRREGGADGGTK